MENEIAVTNSNNEVLTTVENQPNILQVLLDGFFTYVQPFAWIYVISAVLFILGSFVYLCTITPLYRATCQIHISQNRVNVINVQGMNDPTLGRGDVFFNTQVTLLKSKDVVAKAYEQLGLTNAERAKLQLPTSTNVKDTNLVNLSIVSEDPELAAKASNAIVQAYIDSMQTRKSGLNDTGAELLQGQLLYVTQEHENAVQELLRYKNEHNIYDFNSNYSALKESLSKLQDRILADESKSEEVASIYKEIEADKNDAIIMLPYLLMSHHGSEGGVESANLIATKLNHLQSLALTHQMNLPELTAKYGANNLAVQIHNSVGDLIRETEEMEITTGLRGMQLTIDQLKKHKAFLEKRAADVSNQMAEMDKIRSEYHRREASVNTLEKNMDLLVSRIYELQVSDVSDKMNDFAVFITAPAVVPRTPFYPVKIKTMGIGLIMGLGLAALISFILVSMNNQITSLDVFNNYFGKKIPDFGTVPSVLVNEKSLENMSDEEKKKASEERRDLIDEAFREIRTSLNLSLVTRNSKILAVCSAISGEGKTFTATNLARSFAKERKRVLLIDCDLRKPDVHHHLKGYLPDDVRKRGVSNVLIGDCKLMDVVHRIDKLNLDIVTTGPVPPNPNELLSVGHLTEMLEDAKANYDFVIMDTSPIMLVPDFLLIAHQGVPSILVTRLFATDKGMCRQMASQLKQANLLPAGLIANGADIPTNTSAGYGYGYGKYGYGKYGYGKYGKYGYGKYGKYGYGKYGYGARYGRKPETTESSATQNAETKPTDKKEETK